VCSIISLAKSQHLLESLPPSYSSSNDTRTQDYLKWLWILHYLLVLKLTLLSLLLSLVLQCHMKARYTACILCVTYVILPLSPGDSFSLSKKTNECITLHIHVKMLPHKMDFDTAILLRGNVLCPSLLRKLTFHDHHKSSGIFHVCIITILDSSSCLNFLKIRK